MNGLGLQTDAYTWVLFAGLVVVWIASLKLVPTIKANGPVGLIYSFWGLTWIAFGITFVLRFVILVRDSVNFGNDSYRLADQPSTTVNFSLELLILFLISVCAGLIVSNRVYIGNVYPLLHRMAICEWRDLILFITCPALFCTVLTAPFMPLPAFLFTPLKLVAALWVIPVSVVWWSYFTGERVKKFALLFVLSPALLTVVLTPYREFVLQAALAIILAAAFAGRRIRVGKLGFAALGVYIASSAVIITYRAMLWYGQTFQEATAERNLEYYWMLPLSRFHAFDSLLLTAALVPENFPYSHRDVFSGSIVRGVIPRAIYPDKEVSDRGLQFSRTIWGFDDSEDAEASIAPSMPGDLYEAGGVSYVALGAAIFGFCIGTFENSRKRLPLMLRCCFLAFFATHFLGAVERDFAHVVSTLIQVTLAANAVVLVLPTGWSREGEVAPIARV